MSPCEQNELSPYSRGKLHFPVRFSGIRAIRLRPPSAAPKLLRNEVGFSGWLILIIYFSATHAETNLRQQSDKKTDLDCSGPPERDDEGRQEVIGQEPPKGASEYKRGERKYRRADDV
jgi:hypothetical protein